MTGERETRERETRERETREPDAEDKRAAAEAIERKAERKEEALRRGPGHGVWFGFGMFGMVGWAIAVPTLVGIALGLWLDRTAPGEMSWTLALLLAGVALGCVNAWWWISRESRDD